MELTTYLLKSAGILAIFYSIYFIFLKKETSFIVNRHFLIAGIIAALVFPFVTYNYTTYIAYIPVEATTNTLVDSIVQTETIKNTNTSPIDWTQLLPLVYMSVVGVLVAKMLLQLFSITTLLRTNEKVKKGKYVYVKVKDKIAPFSFFNYIVFNPSLHHQQELEMILAHEKTHATQWHSIDILLVHLIRAIQWINPFSWFYKQSIETNLEYIADSETAKQVPSKKAYQLALVKTASSLPVPALTNNFYQSFIKKRIIMLNKNHSKSKKTWKVIFILPALALFLWSFNVQEIIEYVPTKQVKTTSVTKAPEKQSISESKREASSLAIKSSTQNASETSPLADSQEETLAEAITQGTITNRSGKRTDYKITKNTTDAELKEIKAQLKEKHNITMTYDVKRNSSNQIIAIDLEYKGDGKNGMYRVNSDDDEGIDDLHFVINDDGDITLGNLKNLEKQLVNKKKELVAKRKVLAERRKALKVEREKMNEERKKMRKKIAKERAASIARVKNNNEENIVVIANDNDTDSKIIIDTEAITIDENTPTQIVVDGEVVALDEEDVSIIKLKGKGANRVRVASGVNGAVEIVSESNSGFVSISKDTSDEDLSRIKKELANVGVTFNYKRVKRNARGEITGIKIDMNNGRGSKSTTSVKTDDGEPIETIILEIN